MIATIQLRCNEDGTDSAQLIELLEHLAQNGWEGQLGEDFCFKKGDFYLTAQRDICAMTIYVKNVEMAFRWRGENESLLDLFLQTENSARQSIPFWYETEKKRCESRLVRIEKIRTVMESL